MLDLEPHQVPLQRISPSLRACVLEQKLSCRVGPKVDVARSDDEHGALWLNGIGEEVCEGSRADGDWGKAWVPSLRDL